jgi:hypothetical protein
LYGTVAMKVCTECQQEKPATQEYFYWQRRDRLLRAICKVCHSKDNRENYLQNREKVIRKTLERKAANKQHYKRLNTDAARRWREVNKARHRETVNKWRTATKDVRNAAAREYYKKKRQSPLMRLNDAVRARVRQMVHKNGESQSVYLPFSSLQLKEHLERQFLSGMTWDNFGQGPKKWHIDHIVPLASFTFTCMQDPEFKIAWALSNLRPLWRRDNLLKGAKRKHLL